MIAKAPNQESSAQEAADRLWAQGYSIGELWGRTEPVSRGGPSLEKTHLIMWGILSIVDDQVRTGAGHEYLRDRLWQKDWVAVGKLDGRMTIIPPTRDAKFGRKPSAIGHGDIVYADVRVVHSRHLDVAAAFINGLKDDPKKDRQAL
jgi:hypothetical protein